MNLSDRVKKKSKTMEVFATAGTIGMHMVSGPIVGFGIGYGLDKWLETDPWFKLIFFLIGIGAGFLNVHRDSQNLLRKMQKEGPTGKGQSASQEAASANETVEKENTSDQKLNSDLDSDLDLGLAHAKVDKDRAE